MTIARRIARRPLLAAVGLLVTAAGVSGCEPSKNFWITNATSQTVTVQSRNQSPGALPDPSSPVDLSLTLQPGEKGGVVNSLRRGGCLDITLSAYDQNGKLVDQDPTPICEDKNGHGNTWVIKGK